MNITGNSALEIINRESYIVKNNKYGLYGFLMLSAEEICRFSDKYQARKLIFDLHYASGNYAIIYMFYKGFGKNDRLLNEDLYYHDFNLETWIASSNESYVIARKLNIDTRLLPGIAFFRQFDSNNFVYYKLGDDPERWVYNIRILFDKLKKYHKKGKALFDEYRTKSKWCVMRYKLIKLVPDEQDAHNIFNIYMSLNNRTIQNRDDSLERNNRDIEKLTNFEKKYKIPGELVSLLKTNREKIPDGKREDYRYYYTKDPLKIIKNFQQQKSLKKILITPLRTSFMDIIKLMAKAP